MVGIIGNECVETHIKEDGDALRDLAMFDGKVYWKRLSSNFVTLRCHCFSVEFYQSGYDRWRRAIFGSVMKCKFACAAGVSRACQASVASLITREKSREGEPEEEEGVSFRK